MIYIVYEQWDETGPSPVAFEPLENANVASSFINSLDIQKSKGVKYKIILIVEGDQLKTVKSQRYEFLHKDTLINQ